MMIVHIENVARALDVIAASELAGAMKLIADIDKLPMNRLGIYEGKKQVTPACLMEVLDVSEGKLLEIIEDRSNSSILKSYWVKRLSEANCVLKLDEEAKTS